MTPSFPRPPRLNLRRARSATPPPPAPRSPLPSPPSTCLAQYTVSLLRKCLSPQGVNVGGLYVTSTHLHFLAHVVAPCARDRNVSLPLHAVTAVRKVAQSRLFPHAVLVRSKAAPEYVVVLPDPAAQAEVARVVRAAVAEAREITSDESLSFGDREEEGKDRRRGFVGRRRRRRGKNVAVGDALLQREEDDSQRRELASDISAEDAPFPVEEHGDNTGLHSVVPPVRSTDEDGPGNITTLESAHQVPRHTRIVTSEPTPHRNSPELQSSFQGVSTSAVAAVHENAKKDSHQESFLFCLAAFVLMFVTVIMCAILYLLQLRISVIASHLPVPT